MMIPIEYSSVISPCGEYRYRLSRHWHPRVKPLVFVVFNPSVTDDMTDDSTTKRCMALAERDGYGGAVLVSLYALRAPTLDKLWASPDPIGPGNDGHLRNLGATYDEAVIAWGNNAPRARVAYVSRLLESCKLRCFGLTKQGAPRHPLSVSATVPLVPVHLMSGRVTLP